jgi:hypothetical protein
MVTVTAVNDVAVRAVEIKIGVAIMRLAVGTPVVALFRLEM